MRERERDMLVCVRVNVTCVCVRERDMFVRVRVDVTRVCVCVREREIC